MFVIDSDKAKAEQVQMEGAKDVTIQVLISHPPAPTFVMRRFRLKLGGYTPLHTHDYEHEVYVLQGLGEVRGEKESITIKPGSVVFIPRMRFISSEM